MTSITHSKSWIQLKKHHDEFSNSHMRDLFNDDPDRFDKFNLQFDDLLYDFSKNIVSKDTLNLLYDVAKEAHLGDWVKTLFSGEKINFTENRAALHIALRNRSNKPILVDGKDVMPEVNAALKKMRLFSEAIRAGETKGFTGKKFKTIVNIGIGGSDLGPAMVCNALKSFGHPDISPIFVSNVDGSDISQALEKCDPETTLFIIASKTFTTQETMTNAFSAREWLLDKFGNDNAIKNHFAAISTNESAVKAFGISTDNMFEFWDWVGGRYSLWSSIGLSIAIYIGMNNFEDLLLGAHEIDNHFINEPFEKNIPVTLAMIGIWYINFYNYNTLSVLPYDQGLSLLPSYLQQADMESNGKFIGRDGKKVCLHTGPIVWGEAGTNGQHAFYQLIHQGTDIIPTDFIMPIKSQYKIGHDGEQHHKILFSNFVAQSRALMLGKAENTVRAELEGAKENINIEEIIPHKSFEGNRPSNSFLFKELNPKSLGRLLAIYEHKVFVQGIIWNINSFDQWGVEYGKQIASLVLPVLDQNKQSGSFDSSTDNLINYFKNNI
jgi:glucose-6-phosphate isomerase